MSDTVTLDSNELPEVLITLAGVLPKFTGDDLEAQLQTYDVFLDMGCDRFKIAALLADAATKTTDAKARARIEWAVQNVRMAGRAAAPYDHAAAMADYRKKFAEEHPDVAVAPDAQVEVSVKVDAPTGKREHPKLLAQLDKIEAEMKKIGFWADAKTGPAEIENIGDAPTFELWLQRGFLPRARAAARNDTLPKESQVGVMAMRQYDYMDCIPEAHPLMVLLTEFDELVGLASVGGA